MSEDHEKITIRPVEITDVDKLIIFFKKAYGEQTIFQSKKFLLYFFDSRNKNIPPFSTSLIALSPDGEIVSHYGGLNYELKLNGKVTKIVWGANAYTIPEWRGKGLNSKIVDYLHKTNEINAVIGMPSEAPFFYKKYGYNIFNKETLSRYIYVLSDTTFKIVEYIGQDVKKAKNFLGISNELKASFQTPNIVELNNKNIEGFVLDLDSDLDIAATTYRSKEFLKWRLLENPFIKYTLYGYTQDQVILAYIALREEILHPFDLKVNRIIDLYGREEYIPYLLDQTIKDSTAKKCVYIDFSMFGVIYDEKLISSGFVKLEGDDCALLPQVTAPIENRVNHEFICIQSKKYSDKINQLSKEDVYFTRIDSDRDRLGRISQIK